MTMDNIRIGTTEEPPMQASKWLKCQALLDVAEMESLFNSLPPFSLYACGTVCPRGQSLIPPQEFLKSYAAYVNDLKAGILPDASLYRRLFAPVMTSDPSALFAIPVGEDRQLVRIAKPAIQMQSHHIDYSTVDNKFRSMVFGSDSIPWGIQFSYPQLFQDNATKQIVQVIHSPEFPNTALFQSLQRWMRQHTIPTPFQIGSIKVNYPARLGKSCIAWINRHPQLIKKGISVK